MSNEENNGTTPLSDSDQIAEDARLKKEKAAWDKANAGKNALEGLTDLEMEAIRIEEEEAAEAAKVKADKAVEKAAKAKADKAAKAKAKKEADAAVAAKAKAGEEARLEKTRVDRLAKIEENKGNFLSSLTQKVEEEPKPIKEEKRRSNGQRDGMAQAGPGLRKQTIKREAYKAKLRKEQSDKRRGIHKVYDDKPVENIGKAVNMSDVQKERGNK